MTQTRYFYTDPLAAAWMAKHHGVKILGPVLKAGGERGISSRPMPVWILARAIEAAEKGLNGEDDKYYIHPDSLPMLEPQQGNLGKVRWIPGEPESAECYFPIHIDKTRHDVLAIIQRNGIAFHMPESEDAPASVQPQQGE